MINGTRTPFVQSSCVLSSPNTNAWPRNQLRHTCSGYPFVYARVNAPLWAWLDVWFCARASVGFSAAALGTGV